MRLPKLVWLGLGLLPLLWLLHGVWTATLGANPIERLIRVTGDWTLWFLLLTLSVTPLRAGLGWAWMGRLRRMLGLFSFFYAVVHGLCYVVLDQFFAWEAIWQDILKRQHITVGISAWLLLFVLAMTSTRSWKRRLGRHWGRVHRMIYWAALLGVLHHFMMVKADWRLPVVHGVVLVLLLGWRLWYRGLTGSRE